MMDPRPLEIYKQLVKYYGPQHWWPADTDVEMIVGAILTQAVSWENASRAIENLKENDLLHLSSLKSISVEELALCIKPCGYYNLKARRLKSFIAFIYEEWQGDLGCLKGGSLYDIRSQLLTIWGLGPETVDSILLYGGGRPIFVVDSYTIRITERLGLLPKGSTYATTQDYYMENLPEDVSLFGEYHALFVALAKDYCKKNPLCSSCFLKSLEEEWKA